MSDVEFRIRSRTTGETFAAVRLGKSSEVGDPDEGTKCRVSAGSIVVIADERHPDWPESRVIRNIFGPRETAEFAEAYEVVEVSP
jgi:hypothetical protein